MLPPVMSCLPLQLTLRGKSITQSYLIPIYYVDLTLRECINLKEVITSAKDIDQQNKAAGFYQHASQIEQIQRGLQQSVRVVG